MEQKDLLQKAEKYIPGACLGAMSLPKRVRMVMTHGKGSKIYDAKGKEYIDYVLGSGPLILGHNHPEVVNAVCEQVKRGATFYALNEPAIELAETLVDAVPCAEAIRYQTTGSDATLAATRLARAWAGKDTILKFEGSFHGGHDLGQISVDPIDSPPFPSASIDYDGIPGSSVQDVLVAPFNNADAAQSTIQDFHHRIAAVIVEPLQRAIRPEPKFLERIRDVTRRFSIPLIFDEVVTGFRLAWGGAQERYGVTPDLACFGKIIGGGHPLSAVLGKKEILESADPNSKSAHCFLGGTLTGNPVSCAAGLKTLEVLKRPGTYERLHEIGTRLREGIREIGIDLDIPLQVLGDGPVLQTFFVDPTVPLKNYRDLLKADKKKALEFSHRLIHRGIYCTPGGKFYLSLAHSDKDIDQTLGVIKKTLKGMKK